VGEAAGTENMASKLTGETWDVETCERFFCEDGILSNSIP
jgi:hypothetical protein